MKRKKYDSIIYDNLHYETLCSVLCHCTLVDCTMVDCTLVAPLELPGATAEQCCARAARCTPEPGVVGGAHQHRHHLHLAPHLLPHIAQVRTLPSDLHCPGEHSTWHPTFCPSVPRLNPASSPSQTVPVGGAGVWSGAAAGVEAVGEPLLQPGHGASLAGPGWCL